MTSCKDLPVVCVLNNPGGFLSQRDPVPGRNDKPEAWFPDP